VPVDRSLEDTRLTRFGFWSGVWVLFFCTQKCKAKCGCGAVVAHHLAKVRVASSNLVIRSSVKLTRGWSTDWWPPSGGYSYGGVAERRGTGLQSRSRGFKSRLHLQSLQTPVYNRCSYPSEKV
jgi:hypothetical protein